MQHQSDSYVEEETGFEDRLAQKNIPSPPLKKRKKESRSVQIQTAATLAK